MSCLRCGANTGIKHCRLCLNCYDGYINSRLLSDLTANFSPVSEYNRVVFDLYVASLKEVVCLGRLIQVAERFKVYLEKHPLPELVEWLQIIGLSEQVNIRYAQTGQFCPIIRVARHLSERKQLPSIKGYIELSSNLKEFGDSKSLLQEYFYTLDHLTISSKLTQFRTLLAYHQNYGILPINPESVRSHFEFLDRKLPTLSKKNQQFSALRNFYEWLTLKKLATENPGNGLHFIPQKIVCRECGEVRSHLNHNLCPACHLNIVVGKKLATLEGLFQAASPYNEYLFKLYVKYLRRYHLNYAHTHHSRKMAEFLSSTPVAPVKTWSQIIELNSLVPNENVFGIGGNGFIKIGRMLEELGVLEHRELDRSFGIDRTLKRFDGNLRKNVDQFLQCLRQNKIAEVTIRSYLRGIEGLSSWYCAKYGSNDILTASRKTLENFVDSTSPTEQQLEMVKIFFKWAKRRRLSVQNPIQHIKRSKRAEQMKILPPEKIKKLVRFIKDEKSDPEYAFFLALALYWGFTAKDFAFSTLDDNGETLGIHVFQQKLTAGVRTHKPNIITLPSNPVWFLKLQKRFQASWRRHYEKTTKTFPAKRLCLPNNHGHNRPLATFTIRNRIAKATLAATGETILLKTLRTTCATLHIHGTDGSLLTTLGWSKQTAYKYTWCPREYVTPITKPKASKQPLV